MRRKARPFHPDRHRRQTLTRLILGGLFILLTVGGGLAWALYGFTAAVTTAACVLGAVGLIGLLWLILTLLELWVREEE